jgi:excisionase family DNA binding protein
MSEPAPNQAEQQLLYRVPRAARLLDLGVSTIWKMISDGRLSTVKIGRSTRIPHSELVKLAGTSQL